MENEDLVLLYRQTGKNEYLERLYTQNIPLIMQIATRYSGRADMEDLSQEGFFGIVKAIETWNPEEGTKFMTYAAYWIRAYMAQYCDNNANMIRIPTHTNEAILRAKTASERYFLEHGKAPSVAELAKAVGVSIKQMEKTLKNANIQTVSSLNEGLGGTEGLCLEDVIADPGDMYEGIEDNLQNEQLAKVLWGMVDTLDQEQGQIIRAKYLKGYNSRQISEHLGGSPEQIRQKESVAIRALRKNSDELKPFVPDERLYSCGIRGTGIRSFLNTWTSATEKAVLMTEK